MRLETESAHDTVVMAVDVSVDAVETLEEHFDGLLKAIREWNSGLGWKDAWVAEVVGGPGQEMADVGGSWKTSRFWECRWIVPEIFELVRSLHLRAGLR